MRPSDIGDVQRKPALHSHWVRFDQSEPPVYFICPRCGRMIAVKNGKSLKDFPYCGCGAKMDEEV